MKTGFKDPIAVKGESKKMKSPWNYDQPHYDERSSCYVNSGSHYGVGHRQPVGHEGNPKTIVGTMPEHRAKTMKIDEIPRKNLPVDMEL